MEFFVNEKIVIALIAALSAIVGGIITSVVSPKIKAKLDYKTKDEERKRALIQEWRKMLLELHTQSNGHANRIASLAKTHPSYLSLEPLLSEEAKKNMYCKT